MDPTILPLYRAGAQALRWRTGDEQPPAAVRIASPYDLEARYSSKRETHWVGYKLHLTETCDADHPDLITQVMTTPATTQDSVAGPAIQQDLADRDLLLGYTYSTAAMDADLLVTAQTPHQIDVVGPPFGSYSRQSREGKGYTTCRPLSSIGRPSRRCPQGHSSVDWRPGHNVSGDPVIRIRFDGATVVRVPPAGSAPAQAAPRQLTVSPQAHHEALRAARQRQETPQFKAQYALRAGWRAACRGDRRFDLRRSRYLGLARTHPQLLTATAMNGPGDRLALGRTVGRAPAAGQPPSWHPIHCRARRCSVKGGLTQQSRSWRAL